MGFAGGSTVTYRAGLPNPAKATATLASPPPKVATKRGDCRNRSKPGGASRSMVSPKVTTKVDMKNKNTGSRGSEGSRRYCRFLNYLDSCITVVVFHKKNRTGRPVGEDCLSRRFQCGLPNRARIRRLHVWLDTQFQFRFRRGPRPSILHHERQTQP